MLRNRIIYNKANATRKVTKLSSHTKVLKVLKVVKVFKVINDHGSFCALTSSSLGILHF